MEVIIMKNMTELNELSKEELVALVIGLQDKVTYLREEIGYLREDKIALSAKIAELKKENDRLYRLG